VLNGGTVTHTLTVQNAGPSAVSDAQVVDTLPDGEVVQSISGASCSGVGIITCKLSALAARGSVKITLKVTASADSPPASTANEAIVSSSTPDPDTSNNSATATVNVVPPSADLSITGTATLNPVRNGGKLTYTFLGPLAATTPTFMDTLPTARRSSRRRAAPARRRPR
jgi:uncharacterized repeat protein (TIGR01451 family)